MDDKVVWDVVAESLRARGQDVMRVPPEVLQSMYSEVQRVLASDEPNAAAATTPSATVAAAPAAGRIDDDGWLNS